MTAGSGASILRDTDFIATARRLADAGRPGRPLETDLRRAVSTAYYALFHCLAACCADTLVGSARRNERAWLRTYRALQHGTVRRRCQHRDTADFPDAIRTFANVLVEMQDRRHRADYAPDAAFNKSDVVHYIVRSENAIAAFAAVNLSHRRAFAVHVLFDHNR